EVIRASPPGVGLRNFRFDGAVAGKQFYSIIVPLFFSLLLIVLVYFLAMKLYNNSSVALIAMFLMAISPVDILTSQKVWADDMTACLTVLAVLLYFLAVEKKMPLAAFAGGIACGISAITKQNGAFIAFAIILWHFLINSDRLFRKDTFLKVVFDKNLISFGLGAFLAAGYWFWKVFSVYGSPIYTPSQPDIGRVALTNWFDVVGSRPWYVYLVGTPYQNPLFILAYISPLWLWLDKKRAKNTLLLLIWMLVFLVIFHTYLTGGKEHRYLLPSYPAFAILGAYCANRISISIDRRVGLMAGGILLTLGLIASALWSIPMAFEVLFHNGALIMKPF
ncbi:glycosyltransferase family 39 protein, partial [Candidatus Omnitrophota bacterium]